MKNIVSLFFVAMLIFLMGCSSRDKEVHNLEFGFLLENRSDYHGELIVVRGFLHKDYDVEDSALSGYRLYRDEESLTGSVSQGIDIIFSKNSPDISGYSGKYVKVKGIFTASPEILMGLDFAEVVESEIK